MRPRSSGRGHWRSLQRGLAHAAALAVVALAAAVTAAPGQRVGWGLLFGPKLEPAPPPRASAVPVTGGRPAEGFIHLLLVNAPAVDGAWLLLNGERVADLRRPLTGVAVRPGDVLAVDARRADGPVVIRVVYLSPGLEAPVPGVEVSAWRRVVPIGRVTAAGGTRERASR